MEGIVLGVNQPAAGAADMSILNNLPNNVPAAGAGAARVGVNDMGEDDEDIKSVSARRLTGDETRLNKSILIKRL